MGKKDKTEGLPVETVDGAYLFMILEKNLNASDQANNDRHTGFPGSAGLQVYTRHCSVFPLR